MREAYPEAQVKGEVRRLYKERHGEEPDAMALAAFTMLAQMAYQTAVDVRAWATIMHDRESREADKEFPCGAEMMARLRDLAEKAMENVKGMN